MNDESEDVLDRARSGSSSFDVLGMQIGVARARAYQSFSATSSLRVGSAKTCGLQSQ